MITRAATAAIAFTLALCGCGNQEPPTSPSPVPRPAGARTTAATPLQGDLTFTVTGQQWAGTPSVDRSTFDGRCSVPSDYVVTATITGEVTQLGRLRPTSASHCTQVQWTTAGGAPAPAGATYSDGRWDMMAADGSVLSVRYGQGVVTAGPSGGTFRDEFSVVGGTGRFQGATGSGVDIGSFASFTSPTMAMRMSGTIVLGRRAPADRAIRGEFSGRVLEAYTAANPAHRATIQQACGVGASSFTVSQASGMVTHFGLTTAVLRRCQYGPSWSAKVTLSAANADGIGGSIAGGGTAPDGAGNYTWYAEPVRLTEGTGRFAGAVLEGSWTGGGNIDGTGYSTLDGTLRYRNAVSSSR